ncbi:MAG: hypothetical protein SOY07_07210, partial [Bacteroidales bacterium]|nr:hypothetical protein [Bacteroidales bacterium]
SNRTASKFSMSASGSMAFKSSSSTMMQGYNFMPTRHSLPLGKSADPKNGETQGISRNGEKTT